MGQFAVLEALFHKGDLTIGQVQEKILSTSGTIPVIIKNLEKRGLLIRLPDAGDKRKCILHITEQGSSLIQQVYPENEAMIIESMHNWTNDEKCELLKLLKKFEVEHGKKSNLSGKRLSGGRRSPESIWCVF